MASTVISGAKWATSINIGRQAVQFLSGLVLARLLSPEDFGLMASVYVVTTFALIVFELGFTAALVSFRNPSQKDESTVFWVNLASGVMFFLLILAISPLASGFFGQPALLELMPIAGVSFMVSLGVVQAARLQRRIDFRRLALIEGSAAASGALSSIGLALSGWGVYSLAVGPVVASTVETLGFFLVEPWRPRSFVSRMSLRKLWGFARGLLGFNVVNYWSRNADNLLLARFAGPEQLAFYNRSYNFMLLPVFQITGALQRVMFPALTEFREDLPRARHAYLRAVSAGAFITTPILVGIAAVSEALVPTLWGESWQPMAPLLQVLCLAGVIQCMTTSGGWIFQAFGKTDLMFKLGVGIATLTVATIGAGLYLYGTQGVAVGVLVSSWVYGPIGLAVAARSLDLRLRQIIGDSARTWLGAGIMGSLVYLFPRAVQLDAASTATLIVQVALGTLAYITLALVLQPARTRMLLGKFLRS